MFVFILSININTKIKQCSYYSLNITKKKNYTHFKLIILLTNLNFILFPGYQLSTRNPNWQSNTKDVKIIRTRKGNFALMFNGYKFHKHSIQKEKIYWRCSNFRYQHCKVTLYTIGEKVCFTKGEHNHSPIDETWKNWPTYTMQYNFPR